MAEGSGVEALEVWVDASGSAGSLGADSAAGFVSGGVEATVVVVLGVGSAGPGVVALP